jgi:hypothetical protein
MVSVDSGGMDVCPHFRPGHPARTTALPTPARPSDDHDTGPRHTSGPMARRSRQSHPRPRRPIRPAEVNWNLLTLTLGWKTTCAATLFGRKPDFEPATHCPRRAGPRTRAPNHDRHHRRPHPDRTPRRHTCRLAPGLTPQAIGLQLRMLRNACYTLVVGLSMMRDSERRGMPSAATTLRDWRIVWLLVEMFRTCRGIPRLFAERVIVTFDQRSALMSAGSTDPTTTLSQPSSERRTVTTDW